MARAFTTRAFDRWARKERVGDGALWAAIDGADAGLVDADLKGCLVKLRVARPGAGKRDGYRTIVAYRREDRAFFLYGFAKNQRANVREDEAEGYEELGEYFLGLAEREIVKALTDGKLREIER